MPAENTENNYLYHFVPTKFALYFWAVFDSVLLSYPIFYSFDSRLELILHISFGIGCLLLSLRQFVFYYEIGISNEGVSVIFLFSKKIFTWQQINRVKSFKTNNENKIMMQFETGEDIFKFKVPRRDADGIYEVLRKTY
ncbi:hypothetical protein KAJ27_25945 [bacterium]|nr:hypothetical protein [bacterium]